MIIQKNPSPTVPVASSASIATTVPAAPVRAPAVDATPASEPAQPESSAANIGAVVAEVNQALSRSGSALQFTIDRDTDTAVVTMVDAETGEVIRQIPSEEALAIARSIDAMLQRIGGACTPGILCKQTA